MRRFYLLIFITAVALRVCGGDIRHITMRDGLSSRQVYELEGDGDGFVWMYTNSGLERYDGYRFKHYQLVQREEKIDHITSATTMQRGADGSLWIAVKSGKIYSYCKQSDRFVKRVDFNDRTIDIYHFALLPDGKIAVGTSKGLYIATPGAIPQRIALDGILLKYVLPYGNAIYVGSEQGVYRIDSSSNPQVMPVSGTKGINVKSLAIASGRLYIGPFDDDVFAVDMKSGRRYSLPFSIPPIPVNAMVNMGADTLLLGVDGAGVYMIDSRDGHLLRHYRDGDDSNCELSGSTVTDIHIDDEGGLWVSTSHSGVNYISPYENSLSVVKKERGNVNSLPSSHVNAVYEDSHGERWIGTDNGLSRYNPHTGQWRHYLQNHNYSANVILSIGEDSAGNIWVGSYGEGAACIDRNTHEVKHMPSLTPGGNYGVGSRYLFTSFPDKHDNVWLGGNIGLITKYNIATDTYSYYQEDCVSAAINGRNDHLLLAGNKGVGEYDSKTDKFKWTNTFGDFTLQYPVRSLLYDRNADVLWIGTMGEGLIRYDYATGTARRYTSADDSLLNTVYAILCDKTGVIWVVTESNLYRYNGENDLLEWATNFTNNDSNIDHLSFNPGGFIAANGDVMLASSEGCVIFNPCKQPRDFSSLHLVFTNLIINDKTIFPEGNDGILQNNIDMVDRIELNHNDNNIVMDFAVINMPFPNRIGYEYMLEGYDTEFKKPDALPRAQYMALEPGKYLFRVKAIDLFNGKKIEERTMTIIVRSPWWLSWWAKAFYAVILVAFSILAWGYLKNRRREKQIENQINIFTNIAHDIRTPMSMIKAPLQNVEQEQNLSEEGRHNLGIVRDGIEKTLSMLTAVLDISKIKTGSEQVDIALCDIREFIQAKCMEFIPLAKHKGINLRWEISYDMPHEVPMDFDKLSHVADNIISNAIKYTFEGSVTVSAELTGINRWRLSVKDTGIGISHKDGKRIFNYRHRGAEAIEKNIPGTGMGLIFTRRLVKLLRGKISFTSSEQGTEFVVTLPLQYGKALAPLKRHQPSDSRDNESIESDINTGRRRIFVVDDDADMRNFLQDSLGSIYDVTTYSDPTEILELLREVNPDMVIADVMMPKMRGDELCRYIKTDIATSHIPVILLSGLAERSDVVSGLDAQADDYVVKPFDVVVLKARIRNIFKNRQQLSREVLADDNKPEEVEYTNELDRQFMVKAMEILNENLAESEFSVVDLCAAIGMSRTSVYNKIRSITGQSVNEFIRIVRLNKSKELLSTKMYNVSEVAYMVGFSDPKYFSTCFKKQFGVSPSKFTLNG